MLKNILVYYHLDFIFVGLTIVSIGYIILTELFALLGDCCGGSRNTSSQMITEVLDEAPGEPNNQKQSWIVWNYDRNCLL